MEQRNNRKVRGERTPSTFTGWMFMLVGRNIEMLERLFRLKEHNTTWQREVSGGLTTFMTIIPMTFSITEGISFGLIS